MTWADDAPGYWMHETSGLLRPAIEAYYAGFMTDEHIAAMRAYLRQWIAWPVWDHNPFADREYKDLLARRRAEIDTLTTPSAIKEWLDGLAEVGMDPL